MVRCHGICSTSKWILNALWRCFSSAVTAKIGFSFQTNVPCSVAIREEATRGPNQKADLQTPAPPSPQVQKPDPHGGFHLLSPTEQFLWSPVGGAPMFILLQQLVGHDQEIYPDMQQQDNTFHHHTSHICVVADFPSWLIYSTSLVALRKSAGKKLC